MIKVSKNNTHLKHILKYCMTSLNRINFGIEQETGLPYKAQTNMAYSMIWKREIKLV